MMNAPRNRESVEEVYLLHWMFKNDIHRWIIAKETGNDGLKHWQVRLESRYTWNQMKKEFPTWHIEEAKTTEWTYERKEGNYLSSTDTPEVLARRFPTLRKWQKNVLELLKSQGDRTIDVVIDSNGNHGKSFLISHLWETGQAHCVQGQNNAKGIVQDCASEFITNGWRPIVVIDIPWSWKWTNDLYVALERIKDGLIKDTRYGSKTIDLAGVKVLVMTNTSPNLSKLAKDRWRLTTLSDAVPPTG